MRMPPSYSFFPPSLVQELTGAAEVFHTFQMSIAGTPGVSLAPTPDAPYTFIVSGNRRRFITFYDEEVRENAVAPLAVYVKISFVPVSIWDDVKRELQVDDEWENLQPVTTGRIAVTIALCLHTYYYDEAADDVESARASPDQMECSQQIAHSVIDTLLRLR